jgi:hypothetical protein
LVSTRLLTLYHLDKKRGTDAMVAMVAKKVRGVLSDLAETLAGPQAALAANAGNRKDKELP